MVHFSPPHLSVSCTKTGTHKCDSSSRQIENKFRSISTQWNGSCGNLAKWHRTKPGSVYSPILLCFLYLLTVAQVCIPTSTAFPSIIKHLLEQAHSLERKARKAIKTAAYRRSQVHDRLYFKHGLGFQALPVLYGSHIGICRMVHIPAPTL